MPTLSLCMIVKDNEDTLDRCLASVCRHVDETIIVDTGSTDRTKEIAKHHGARLFDFTHETHPAAFFLDDAYFAKKYEIPGPVSNLWTLGDFAAARNHSFAQATGDYVLWLDSDDALEGGERLRDLVKLMAAEEYDGAVWQYDYATNQLGQVVTRQSRERVVKRSSKIKWHSPVHEVLMPLDKVMFAESIVVKHCRSSRRPTPNRNLKIITKHYEETKDNVDPRTLFYLGQENLYIDQAKAVRAFEAYLAVSGWDEERALARTVLGRIAEVAGNVTGALSQYSAASVERPDNPDGFFGLARVYFIKKDWAKCVDMTERAFAIGNPLSALVHNPLERAVAPHICYSEALFQLGRVKDAVLSCEHGLHYDPTCTPLRDNKTRYEHVLEERRARSARVPLANELALNEPVEAPARRLPAEALGIMAIQIWKTLRDGGELDKADRFLHCLPRSVEDLDAVKRLSTHSSAWKKVI